MPELNDNEISALAKAVNLELQFSDMKDINYSLNSMIEAVESITPEGINSIEPLPIVIPSKD